MLGLYSKVNEHYKCIFIILLAIWRKKFGDWMENRISHVAVSEKDLLVKGITFIQQAVFSKAVLVILLCPSTNTVVVIFLFGLPVLTNIYLCYQVVKLHREVLNNVEQDATLISRKNIALLKLIVNELTELCISITFVVTLICAFYGPNSTIIGNVKSDHWNFYKINDLSNYVLGVLTMSLIDASCAALSLLIVWKSCNISLMVFIHEYISPLIMIMVLNIFTVINAVRLNNAVKHIFINKICCQSCCN